MNVHEFTKQFAIRLPNDELYSQCQVTATGGHEIVPVIFDTEEAANRVLENLKMAASQLGITSWMGRIEWRACSPFTVTGLGRDFAEEVTKWAAQQGDQS